MVGAEVPANKNHEIDLYGVPVVPILILQNENAHQKRPVCGRACVKESDAGRSKMRDATGNSEL